jgi:excisionase family DNA binding protein
MYHQGADENVEARDFITLREAAAMCGVSRRTVAAWERAGRLVAVLTPEGRCFRRSAIESASELAREDGYPLE